MISPPPSVDFKLFFGKEEGLLEVTSRHGAYLRFLQDMVEGLLEVTSRHVAYLRFLQDMVNTPE